MLVNSDQLAFVIKPGNEKWCYIHHVYIWAYTL